jgi:hypothetical protein
MPTYRFYFTTNDNHLTGVPMRLECADDAAALVKAGETARTATNKANGINVWELNRLVGRVPIERRRRG